MVQAVIETNKGNIVVELYQNETPNTVNNFVKLAQNGFYNGLKFHRVIPDFMVQCGCPKGDGTGGPGYQIDCELRPHLKHTPGTLSMAHAGTCEHDKQTGAKMSGKCSNGSQFFITHVATTWLDGVHTVFGRVIQGQDVVNSIKKGDVMNRVTVQ